MLYAKPLREESPAEPVAAGRGAGVGGPGSSLSLPAFVPAPTPARFLHFPSGHRLGRLFNLLLPGHGTTEDEGSSEWRSLPDSGNWLTLDGSAGAGSGPARESGREEGSQRPHRPRARPPATETSPGAPNPPSQHALSHFPEDGSGFLHDRHKSARPLEPRPRLPSQ